MPRRDTPARAPLPHAAISASAGSGKTFQLAHRYLALLARDVPPDRICALTFSRKAGGEIFDSIVERLAAAADSAQAAAATAARLDLPELQPADFRRMLRALADSLHRVHVGTLDSFLVGIVRAFPFELGLGGPPRILDEDGAEAAERRRAILDQVFNPAHTDAESQRQWLELFKAATFGAEEKALENPLDRLIRDYQPAALLLPDAARWGAAGLLWPRGSWWLDPDPAPAAELADAARRPLEEAAADARLRDTLTRILAFCAGYDEAALWDPSVERLAPFRALFEAAAARAAGAPPAATLPITYSRRQVDLAPADAWLGLVRHVAGIELQRALTQTAGIRRLLERYAALYGEQARETGWLSFADAHALLAPGRGTPALSRRPGPDRLYIDYRLDSRLDHWLLDEFQDTSDLQWSALCNLVDELVQDDSGRRSFFYVGDVKQAIYRWRGGNPRLFERVLARYGDCLQRRRLDCSYRSAAPVIDTVNAVFGDLDDERLPAAARDTWSALWQPHRAAEGVVPSTGYAALLEVSRADGDKPGEEDTQQMTARLVRQLDPAANGFTVAVLVRDNAAGRAVSDAIRRACPGLVVAHEGRAALRDNTVVELLRSLLRLCAHPGDAFARGHLAMSPLAEALAEQPPLARRIPAALQEGGFRRVIQEAGARLEAAGALDAFGRHRLEQLQAEAEAFDRTGSVDVDAFLRHLDTCQIRGAEAAAPVRVMTVHQAKGLGFDCVILPDLAGRSMARAGRLDLHVAREETTDQPQWALRLPRRLIAEHVPPLDAEVARADADHAFDSLCVLYVALTRAKRALYMLVPEPGPTARTLHAAALLRDRLTPPGEPPAPRPAGDALRVRPLYTAGAPDWAAALRPAAPAAPAPAAPAIPPGFAARQPARPVLTRVRPSGADRRQRRLDRLLDPEQRDVLAFGSAVHALFEQVEFAETADPGALLAAWRERSADPPRVQEDVARQFRDALAAPDVRAVLARPAGPWRLWREKRFDIVLDDTLVSGSFDRVLIHLDAPDGRPARAELLDFKSDRVQDAAALDRAAETHRPQLDLYARALARILRLPPDRIGAALVFTRAGRVRAL